ncbi:MAG: pantoate--beta-alanine ligase [Proteobacteria bacterium]|nr:pantoate--beta-alanine ligase [Pseudomonadota bacterium]
MLSLHTVADLHAQVRAWKLRGLRVGFVPTMGNLHDGHFVLVDLACEHADKVVASVFVNPTQFGPNEDFARYPRTLDADARGLSAHGCDVLFAPDVAQMYPFGAGREVQVRVPGITDILDGAHRPGHFDGVATVVARLFNMVQPDVAVFGRKDYQQLQVIQYLVRDLAFPLQIVGAPIVRADDGLALSSRNQYLTAAEREVAPTIHATLQAMRAGVQAGRALPEVEAAAARRLTDAGFVVDYAAIHRADLSLPAADERSGLVALIAARLDATRLIDNLIMD